LNTLVNFQSAQPSKTGQFSFDINNKHLQRRNLTLSVPSTFLSGVRLETRD